METKTASYDATTGTARALTPEYAQARCVELLRAIVAQAGLTSATMSARRFTKYGEHARGSLACVIVPAHLVGKAEGALRMLDLAEGRGA